jgi:hypothetical protein
MTPESQELIDRLIPEFRNLLRDDFVKSLQKFCSGIRGRVPGLCDLVRALTTRYQQAQQTLQRYGNNYEALGQQIVRVELGEYQHPGPAWWSQLNPRVYARVTGGHIWQETSTIEIRVLPSSAAANVTASRQPGGTLRNASYSVTGGVDPAPGADADTADVPLGAVIAYPDKSEGVQVLGPGLEPGGGSGSPTITSVSPVPNEPNPVIVITGSGFGKFTQPIPFKGSSTSIRIRDTSRGWQAGYTGDLCDTTIATWTDSTIIVAANVSAGNAPLSLCRLNAGDQLELDVWNPQSNNQGTAYSSVQALPAQPPPGYRGYKVDGNLIKGPDGSAFIPRGVAYSGLETSPQGDNPNVVAPGGRYPCGGSSWGDPAGELGCVVGSIRNKWHANTIRIALNQDFWLSAACNSAKAIGATNVGYQDLVSNVVRSAENEGMIAILDLHWSDQGSTLTQARSCPANSQQPMADGNSLLFWYQVAQKFANDPQVWFELYNEPQNIDENVWRNGGVVTGRWYAAGMQQLYEVIRAAGASNPILAGGLSSAGTLQPLLPRWALDGYSIAYAAHTYANLCGARGWPTDSSLNSAFGFAAQSYPVIVTEFGQGDGNNGYVKQFIDYADRKGPVKPASRLGWTAWAWIPGDKCYPSLLSNWDGAASTEGLPVLCSLAASAGLSCGSAMGKPRSAPSGQGPRTAPTGAGPHGASNYADSAIVSGIKAKLGRDSALKTQDIRVSVHDGVVTLQGTVGTAAQMKRVESIAQAEKAVRLVIERLAVQSGPDSGTR